MNGYQRHASSSVKNRNRNKLFVNKKTKASQDKGRVGGPLILQKIPELSRIGLLSKTRQLDCQEHEQK